MQPGLVIRRRLLATAGVGLVVLVGAAFISSRGGDDVPGGSTSPRPVPTGFYVPTNLPEGWTVQSFRESSSTYLAEICPCERGTWTDGDRTVIAHRAANPVPSDAEGWNPWDGAAGGRRTLDAAGHVRFWWPDGESATSVIGSGFATLEEAETVVAAWVDADLSAPPGWREVERSAIEDVVAVAQGVGVLAHGDGSLVRFELGPWQVFGDQPDPFAVATADGVRAIALPGSTRTLIGGGGVPNFAGAWPGRAVFRIGANLGEGRISDGVTDEEVIALAAAFEPASAGAWRAFVERADSTDLQPDEVRTTRETLVHPSIDGLVLRR